MGGVTTLPMVVLLLLWWRYVGMRSEEVGEFLPARMMRRYLGLSVWNSLLEVWARSVRAGWGVFSGRAAVGTSDRRRNGAGLRKCATARLIAACKASRSPDSEGQNDDCLRTEII